MRNPDYFITEGFKPRFIVDLGWPWTSDKAMVSCDICQLGMFIKIDEQKADDEVLICVHSFCVDAARRKIS